MQRLAGMFVIVGLIMVLALAAAPASVTEAKDGFPSIINLPNGWRPEGIAIGKGTTFYVGSLANGAIYRGDLRTGAGDILVPGVTGRATTGLYVDERHNYLFASGAGTGLGFVFDARTGETLATYQLAAGTPAGAPTFVNDVVVTKKAAYFTDSNQPFLYKVPLGRGGELPDQSAVERIPLSGDYVFVPGAFNANGIEAASNGKALLVVHSSRGELYRVDPKTGEAALVDLGGFVLTNGDGLRLQGRTLYVVQNRLNQIAVIQLDRDWTSGSVERTITDPNFDVPTTVGLFGNSLYAVNARFTTPPTPDTTYTVVRVSRKP
jgi:sugar lactone lactonase YvrE